MIFHFHQHSEKKTGDPNFGGVGNWKFFCMINIKRNGSHFSICFIMADTDIPFLLTFRKTGDPKLLGGW